MKRSLAGPHPNLWHPFSAILDDAEALPRVVSGRGATLELADGRTVLDCISSWWVNLYGHANPRIADAIYEQANRLEHVIFAGFTHEPAERLAERLAAILPDSLTKVFFSDDGSTSVEVALKMAYQYWQNVGEPRPTFLAFEGAYHGDTFGAMSAGARSAFTRGFDNLLFDVEHMPFPETWIGDSTADARERAALDALEARLESEDRPVAGVILEPLVQGAAGMRMCRESFVRGVRDATRRTGALLILDEVMTGFGRTGARFACRRAGVEPDLICLAKGLTGGFLPLAVTVASEEICNAFRGPDPRKTFWHGHSYTANPLGCAAALASLDLLAEFAPSFSGMEAGHRRFLDGLDTEIVERTRVTGTIAAFDMRTRGAGGYFDRIGDEFKARTLDQGLLIRPLGNTVYLMPPYCITDDELDRAYSGVKRLIQAVARP